MMRRLLARMILLPTGLTHLVLCLIALWLDEQSVADYLDGLVKARNELNTLPAVLIIDSHVCRKGSILIAKNGERLAKLQPNSTGRLQWTGLSPKVAITDNALILRQSDLNQPLRLTKDTIQ